MNNSADDLTKLLREEGARLVVDNDMCYVAFDDEDMNDLKGESFDFGPADLVFILCDELNIQAEMC